MWTQTWRAIPQSHTLIEPSPRYVADLEHWHYDTFVVRWRPSVGYNFPRGFLTFVINKDGKAEELKIDQPNNDFWFYELSPKRVN